MPLAPTYCWISLSGSSRYRLNAVRLFSAMLLVSVEACVKLESSAYTASRSCSSVRSPSALAALCSNRDCRSQLLASMEIG